MTNYITGTEILKRQQEGVADFNKDCQEIFNVLIDYSLDQVYKRMIVYGEPFEVALQNYIQEITNEQVDKPTIR